jgi:hypothetical protein
VHQNALQDKRFTDTEAVQLEVMRKYPFHPSVIAKHEASLASHRKRDETVRIAALAAALTTDVANLAVVTIAVRVGDETFHVIHNATTGTNEVWTEPADVTGGTDSCAVGGAAEAALPPA